MFLPRALKVVKCFFLGEVTRKEKNEKREKERKCTVRGDESFVISFSADERGEKRSFLLAVFVSPSYCKGKA